LGTFFGGWRIVKTMATRLTHLDPYQGFCAETGAAVMLFSTARLGIPVSTTHTISGGIMGVGATRRLSAVRWGVGKRIVIAWILTIPAAATIAGSLFLLLLGLGF
jgi:PiT family inorganic phosphate transporter